MASSAKETALELIGGLPDDATLAEIVHQLEVRQKIEEGLAASRENRVISHDKVKERYTTDGTELDGTRYR
jgi:hypothetical protein